MMGGERCGKFRPISVFVAAFVAVFVALAAGAMAAGAAASHLPEPSVPSRRLGDAARGKVFYQACKACHSVEDNDLGPRHRGVVGRPAGSVANYNYSPALKNSGMTWNPTTLDRWLTNPSALIPGTKMFFKIDDPQMRADIIAYLEELK